jgi:hypothetical protein
MADNADGAVIVDLSGRVVSFFGAVGGPRANLAAAADTFYLLASPDDILGVSNPDNRTYLFAVPY